MSTMPAWLSKISEQIKREIPKEFVGQVEINVFKGGITNVNVRESFKCEAVTK